MLNEIARNKLDEAGADRRTARTLHVDKVREGSAALAGKRLGGFEARVTLPGSQQRLPRAGKWNSCGRGTPYGVTYTHLQLSPAAQHLNANKCNSIESV